MRQDKAIRWLSRGARALVSGSLIAALLFLAPVTLTGCHTTEGAGRDIEEAGEVIQDTVN